MKTTRYKKGKKCIDCNKKINNSAISRCKPCSNSLKQKGKLWSNSHRAKMAVYWKSRKKEFEKRKSSYAAIHLWIRKYYKKKGKCEHCNDKSKKRYEWALIKGKKYNKNINNYVELCVRCHRIYDGTMAWQNKAKLQARLSNEEYKSN